MERVLGELYEVGIEIFKSLRGEYQQVMAEAKAEFQAWERNKKRNRVSTKEKFRAQRLAKLDAMRMVAER